MKAKKTQKTETPEVQADSGLPTNLFEFVSAYGIEPSQPLSSIVFECASCGARPTADHCHVHVIQKEGIATMPEFAQGNQLPLICPRCNDGFVAALRRGDSRVKGFTMPLGSSDPQVRTIMSRLKWIEVMRAEVRKVLDSIVEDKRFLTDSAIAESRFQDLVLALPDPSGEAWLEMAEACPNTDEVFEAYNRLKWERRGENLDWSEDLSGLPSYSEYEREMRKFLAFVQDISDVEVKMEGVKPPYFKANMPVVVKLGRNDRNVLVSGLSAALMVQECFLDWRARDDEGRRQKGREWHSAFESFEDYERRCSFPLMATRGKFRRDAQRDAEAQKAASGGIEAGIFGLATGEDGEPLVPKSGPRRSAKKAKKDRKTDFSTFSGRK